jgi:hypothetical protein
MRRFLLVCAPLFVMACALGSEIDEPLDDGDGNGDGRGESKEGEDDETFADDGEDGDGTTATHGAGPSTTAGGGPTSGPTSGAGGAPTGGDGCCFPSMSPGCGIDPQVEQCVCSQDDYCCTTAWDEQCVAQVDQFGCGFCGGDPGGMGGGDPGGDPGACCAPTGGPGCGDPTTEQCVCDFDPYCCDTEWDDQCVAEMQAFGCGVCQ